MTKKEYELLRNAKEGDVIVVFGHFFHKEVCRNDKDELCPIIIAVEENDTKNECITFSYALGYDDKSDKVLRCWECDYFEYGSYGDDILTVSAPTAKQYAAICKELIPEAKKWISENSEITSADEEQREQYTDYEEQIKKLRAEADYWKKEYELCDDKPDTNSYDYSEQGIADYVAGADDINELAKIFSSAAFRLAYATDQFADSKERIVFTLNNKEYPLQVALVKEAEPLRVQTEFEHTCFMEIHGLATPKQIAFRNYCAELMSFFAKKKTLRNFTDIAKKYGVTGLTKEQFYSYKFDQPDWVAEQGMDYIDGIYEQIKKREK